LRLIRCGAKPPTVVGFREHLSSLGGGDRFDPDVLGIRDDLCLLYAMQKGDDRIAVDMAFGHHLRTSLLALAGETGRNVSAQRPAQAARSAFVVEPTEDSNAGRQSSELVALFVIHHRSATQIRRLPPCVGASRVIAY
jgi:hypothetical protein